MKNRGGVLVLHEHVLFRFTAGDGDKMLTISLVHSLLYIEYSNELVI